MFVAGSSAWRSARRVACRTDSPIDTGVDNDRRPSSRPAPRPAETSGEAGRSPAPLTCNPGGAGLMVPRCRPSTLAVPPSMPAVRRQTAGVSRTQGTGRPGWPSDRPRKAHSPFEGRGPAGGKGRNGHCSRRVSPGASRAFSVLRKLRAKRQMGDPQPGFRATVSLLGFIVLVAKGRYGGAVVCLVIAVALGAQARSRYKRRADS